MGIQERLKKKKQEEKNLLVLVIANQAAYGGAWVIYAAMD